MDQCLEKVVAWLARVVLMEARMAAMVAIMSAGCRKYVARMSPGCRQGVARVMPVCRLDVAGVAFLDPCDLQTVLVLYMDGSIQLEVCQ